jgi:hypothetical protein
MVNARRRLSVTLDGEYAAKLASLAERVHMQEGTLARSLLSRAIDEADVDPRDVVELLDGAFEAFERAHQGLMQARSGRTTALEDL